MEKGYFSIYEELLFYIQFWRSNMPRLFHRIIKDKDREKLALLMEKLASFVTERGGLNSFHKEHQKILENIFHYYSVIDDLTQEEINIIWESVSHIVRKLLKRKEDDVIEKHKSDLYIEENNILYGKYWVFRSKKTKEPIYLKCDDHLEFVRDNGDIFIKHLKIDTFDYLHEIHSGENNVLNLIFSNGGIMANFVMDGKNKVGEFQLSSIAMPWLKSRLVNMPIIRSYIWIVNHHDKYRGAKTGIHFIFRKSIK